jgi:ribonuclease R
MKKSHSKRSKSKPQRSESRDKNQRSFGNQNQERPHSERRGGRSERFGRPNRSDDGPRGPRRERQGKSDEREERRPAREGFERGILRLKGRVDKNAKGFGFLIFEDRNIEDAFIPPREADRLFHGDRVEVTINSRGEVLGLKVLEHRFRELVGKYEPHISPRGGSERGGWIIYERKRAREEIFVPTPPNDIKAGDWIQAKLTFHERGPHRVTAEIVKHFGPTLPASADVGMIAAEFNLIEDHPEDAVREAKEFKLDLSEIDKGIRTDLRQVPFITIDGETARDFDDAIYVERAPHGGYILWVAIADVSHYVKPGTALDKDAHSRGTSVYFPERAFHMLPRALSEHLCSLKPRETRLAFVAKMHFDKQGIRTHTELMEGAIESKRRATYNEIAAEFESQGKDPNWEYAPHFELYRLIRKSRTERGSIDFDLPEAEVVVDAEGEPIRIENRDRLDSHRLIEEFMISANEAVTEWALERNWPFIYRVHEEPKEEAIDKFQRLASNAGIRIKLSGGQRNLNLILADMVRRIDGHAAQTLLNMQLLRSMRQAVYSAEHDIHFGLASRAYTHFTSPIRRYPDLVVHRLLREALRAEKKHTPKATPERLKELQKDLELTAEHCSYRERIAAEADREAIKLKQVRMMLKHVGDEFDGKILGMIESGFFVQIENPWVEGLVSRDSLADDFYTFDEDSMTFTGRRKRKVFRIGDAVKIRVLRADIDRRTIDFGLVTDSGVAPRSSDEKPRPDRQKRPR